MRFLATVLLCVVGLSASTSQTSRPSVSLPHDAYVWQRSWTPTVIDAGTTVSLWAVRAFPADAGGEVWVVGDEETVLRYRP